MVLILVDVYYIPILFSIYLYYIPLEYNTVHATLLYQEPMYQPFKGELVTLYPDDVDKRFNDVKIAIEKHEHSTVG